MRLVGSLDGPRNQIVHWTIASTLAAKIEGDPDASIVLNKPGFIYSTRPESFMRIGQVTAFTEKARLIGGMLFAFNTLVLGNLKTDILRVPHAAWLEIFQRPIIYPLPADHPIIRFRKAPETPPGS